MRWRLLTHPVFTGAVALLAVNDHVLKARWPGLITGKLSDIAGVALIAIALTAITSRTDPTDLIALLALIPLHRWLRQDRSSPGIVLLRPIAVMLALSTTTATGCDSAPQTPELWSADGQLFVTSSRSRSSDRQWSSSADGGRTWLPTDPSTGPRPAPRTDACAKDPCFRALPDVGIDQKIGQAE